MFFAPRWQRCTQGTECPSPRVKRVVGGIPAILGALSAHESRTNITASESPHTGCGQLFGRSQFSLVAIFSEAPDPLKIILRSFRPKAALFATTQQPRVPDCQSVSPHTSCNIGRVSHAGIITTPTNDSPRGMHFPRN